MSALEHLLEIWQRERTIHSNIVQWVTESARPAVTRPFPGGLHPALKETLNQLGISNLFSHQSAALEAVLSGENVVLSTGTASGKSLAYQLPVLEARLDHPEATALFLFPTKALAQDQLNSITRMGEIIGQSPHAPGFQLRCAVYDGDTAQHARSAIRKNARILLTNPDMLHSGILPHHTLWADFFHTLQYVVVDEVHIYRGVFGSHVANVLRRLKRIAAFYGAHPSFILTSATIANPQELAERLIEEPVTVIADDGSPRGLRHFLLYNPPIVNADLGIRRSSLAESVRLSSDLLTYDIQTLIFARSRRATELALKYLREQQSSLSDRLHGYRSGYLPAERREIEQGLRSGAVRGVVATNALELGVDIGGVEAAVLIGYPGSIAATRQQAGRAGRKQQASAAVLVASANPLDQFLVQHTEYLLDRSPEKALINPDNPLILIQHLRCAAFELPFRIGEPYGRLPWEIISQFLEVLQENAEVNSSGDRFFWSADQYPAQQVSLRSSSAQTVLLQTYDMERPTTIGEVDQLSATWMVHPHAIYMHEARTFLVESLDLENNQARLKPVEVDYFTEPQRQTDIQKIEETRQEEVPGGVKHLGELMVTSQVVGFRKMRWFTNEVLGAEPLEMPPSHLRTVGYWVDILPSTVDRLQNVNLWTNAPNDYGPNWFAIRTMIRQRDQFTCQVCGAVEQNRAHHVHHKVPFRAFTNRDVANSSDNLITLCPSCHREAEKVVRLRSGLAGLQYVLNQLAPLFLMCDVSDLGSDSDPESPLTEGHPTVVIYDHVAAGIGLSDQVFEQHEELLKNAYDLVSHCECAEGCPSCIGAAGENGYGGKAETLALLALLNGMELQLPDA